MCCPNGEHYAGDGLCCPAGQTARDGACACRNPSAELPECNDPPCPVCGEVDMDPDQDVTDCQPQPGFDYCKCPEPEDRPEHCSSSSSNSSRESSSSSESTSDSSSSESSTESSVDSSFDSSEEIVSSEETESSDDVASSEEIESSEEGANSEETVTPSSAGED